MVSRPTCGTSLRLITSSVSNRTVQRARSSGGGEQTTATICWLWRWSRAGALPGREASNSARSSPPFLIPRADLPHRLGRKSQIGAYHGGGLSLIHLTQSQGAQYRAHRLQSTAQQLIQLLSVPVRKLNLKPLPSAHVSAIQPPMFPHKYQQWLPIHAVIVLVQRTSVYLQPRDRAAPEPRSVRPSACQSFVLCCIFE
jgi:hypothetical protein